MNGLLGFRFYLRYNKLSIIGPYGLDPDLKEWR